MNAIVPISAAAMPMQDIERVAMAIAKGGLFGSKDPNAVLTLCLLAQAEGQHPAVVFRDYHIISGKPAKKAEAMLRDFIASGGKVEWHALTDDLADATFSHPGGGTLRIDWTMKRAQAAGIANPMWRKYPRQMLRSRVISEGVRSVCPSATSGLYEVGEIQDIVSENPRVEASDGGSVEGQFQEVQSALDGPANTQTSAEVHHDDTAVKPTKRVNWGGRYPTKTALKQAMHTHHAELERLGIEGTFDDLEGYLTSPEYVDFIQIATEHAPYYLDGKRHPDAPPEFIQTFTLEAKARDLIALRGNSPAELETN
jgi:hypothetical protein